MSGISLPLLRSLRLGFFPRAVRRVRDRLFERRRKEQAPDDSLASQAASLIRDYARDHASLFERAQRLREKAERLESAGTPSESAANRAERARLEVEAGLLALRDAFALSVKEKERAFDREIGRLFPTPGPPVQ